MADYRSNNTDGAPPESILMCMFALADTSSAGTTDDGKAQDDPYGGEGGYGGYGGYRRLQGEVLTR